MFFSPFEQFQIYFFIDTVYFVLHTVAIYLVIVMLMFFFLFYLFFFSRNFFSSNIFDLSFENLYTFSYNLIYGQLGKKGQKFIPFFQTVFFFLLVSNLIGLLPYSCALSSHFNVILTISFTIFLGIQYIGFSEFQLSFFKLFLPSGTPLPLVPFIILIEFISYVFRVVSLSIRIIANILSGHILLKILSTFTYNIYLFGGYFFFISLIPLVIVFALTVLETFVCILQAYVYTILSCIYLKDVFYINAH